jgi:hypothetical protein
MSEKLLNLLTSVLGDYTLFKNGTEAYFKSPFNDSLKRKLAVHIDKSSERYGQWHCWQEGFGGHNLIQLFNCKQVKVSKAHYDELKKILNITDISTFGNYKGKKGKQQRSIELPEEFNSFTDVKNTIGYTRAFNYVKKRISQSDIIRYNIGYCLRGEYKNRIIIPSYYEDNQLNYFLARSFEGCSKLPYKNPDVDEDVVVFENQINWEYPITICEGAFDAVAIRRNATPILGKYIPDVLKKKIFEKDVTHINIAMDADAMKTTMEFAQDFINEGIVVNIVDIPKNQDPSSLGFKKMNELTNKSQSMGLRELMMRKLYGHN